jgi:L-2-hydroxyglutarate oxidase
MRIQSVGLSGLESSYSFLLFKGKYWRVETTNRMRKLVYQSPNFDLPFLGVHTAHDRTGETYLGVSSSPVFGRENYRGLNGLHTLEFLALFVSFSKKILFYVNGLRGLAFRKLGLLPRGIYREANRLIQADQGIKLNLSPDKVGIRSEIFDEKNNYLVSDFVIKKQARIIHILNAISLALTTSFGLADMIMDRYIN